MAAEVDIPQQYEARLRDDLTRDELVSVGHRLASGSRWMLGDLACMVEARYGEADLRRYAEEIDVEYASLRAYKAVSQAFPAESVIRLTHSWSVYQVLAAQPDRLELVSGDRMTKAQAQELMAARKPPPRPGQPRKARKPSPSPGGQASAGQKGAQPDGGQRAEEPSEPPQAATPPGQPASPEEPPAEIPVIPGGSPEGGPDAEAAQEPGVAELKAENAVLQGLAGELAAVLAEAAGGWGECWSCHGASGLPVHAVSGKGGKDYSICLACLPALRASRPDVSITFLVPVTRPAPPAEPEPASEPAQDTGPCAHSTDQEGECGQPGRPAWLNGTSTMRYICDPHLAGGWKRRRSA
jgi:hypothetical protein